MKRILALLLICIVLSGCGAGKAPESCDGKGILKKVFHVDIQHSDYSIELKSPAVVSSEAIIIGFGNSSCRSR